MNVPELCCSVSCELWSR